MENETTFPSLTREGTKEEIRHSTKRTKKTEKAGEHHSGRSRSLSRGVPCKSGKPSYVLDHVSIPHTLRTHVTKIATLNINGITAPTRVGILLEFIKTHELDTLFLQEVTNPNTLNFRGYESHHNIRT